MQSLEIRQGLEDSRLNELEIAVRGQQAHQVLEITDHPHREVCQEGFTQIQARHLVVCWERREDDLEQGLVDETSRQGQRGQGIEAAKCQRVDLKETAVAQIDGLQRRLSAHLEGFKIVLLEVPNVVST